MQSRTTRCDYASPWWKIVRLADASSRNIGGNACCDQETRVDLGLKGKTTLVLGGGGGLGRAIATALAREGAKVAVADIDQGAIDRSVDDVRATGSQALGLRWDLGDLKLIEPHLNEVRRQLGTVDVLVNITGGPPPTRASGQAVESWSKHFQSMVLSVIAITDGVLPDMRKKKWGRVITSTSSGVVTPIPNLALSNALRLMLVGWSKTLAREVAPDGITANIVAPGRIATDRVHFLDRNRAETQKRPLEEIVAESVSGIPVGRYGDPQEYADVVTFLASERASYITGSVIRVDGGLIASV
jgi:3-oxoacyl-[acyl-carrier protein] reductase